MTRFLLTTIVLSSLIIPLSTAAPKRIVFDGTESTHKWALKDLNPGLPSDWTPFNFLVLEVRAQTPQRFWLTLYSGTTVQRRQMHPMSGVWIRAVVPLQYFRHPNRSGHDLASVGKVPRNSFWISTGGVYGPLNAVQELGVTMAAPLGRPTLEIRSVTLAKDDPGSDILDKKPVVDEFGQWIPGDWPRKVKNVQQLKKEWLGEEVSLKKGDFGHGRFGGYLNTQVKATGFFRVEKIDGRWWFVDPEGHLFFSTASTGMGNGGGDSRIQGREDYYAAMPPIDPSPSPSRRPRTGFYSWNLARRHGGAESTGWIDLVMRRLEDWGLNTIGNWSDQRLWAAGKKAYQVNMRGWGMGQGYLGMPDVYSEEWVKLVDKEAEEQCAPRKNDPWLLGYFVANEPPWEGRESLVVDIILDRPPSAIQREAKSFLAGGDTPERRKQFIYKAFNRFLEVINAAIKRHDPNHLNLGLRFGGGVPPIEMLESSKAFDVYSMNVYSTNVNPKVMDRIYEVTGRPIIVGEFHVGVPERGLAAGLVQVRDQAERGLAYRYYVEQAAAHPAFIGSSWFQWVDQPSLGRMDGENYNIGLVDVMDRPYPEMIEAMKTTHKRLQAVHSGRLAPYDVKPRAQ